MSGARNKQSKRLATGALWVACSMPFLALAVFVAHFSSNVPWSDDWTFVPLFEEVARGTARLADFTAQHNEHRILFPRLFVCALAFASGWNLKVQLACSVLFTALAFLMICRLALVERELAGEEVPWRLLTFSLLIFSLVQRDSWLWAFQISWVMVNLFVVSAIYSLARARKENFRRALFLSAMMCFLASFSSAHGLLSWFIVAPLLLARPKETRGDRALSIGLWTAFTAVALFLYFYQYQKPARHPDLFLALKEPRTAGLYFLCLIGGILAGESALSMLAGWAFLVVSILFSFRVLLSAESRTEDAPARGRLRRLLAVAASVTLVMVCFFVAGMLSELEGAGRASAFVAGTGMTLVFVASVVNFLRSRRASIVLASGPWLSLGLYAFGFALITTIGRAGFGIGQTGASRYTSVSVLALIAIIQLATLWHSPEEKKEAEESPSPRGRWLYLLCIAAVWAAIGLNSYEAVRAAGDYRLHLETRGAGLDLLPLLEENVPGAHSFETLRPREPKMFGWALTLRRLGFLSRRRGPRPIALPGNQAGELLRAQVVEDKVAFTVQLRDEFKQNRIHTFLFRRSKDKSFAASLSFSRLPGPESGQEDVVKNWLLIVERHILPDDPSTIEVWYYNAPKATILSLHRQWARP